MVKRFSDSIRKKKTKLKYSQSAFSKVDKILKEIKYGSINVYHSDKLIGSYGKNQPSADLIVNNYLTFDFCLLYGSIGFAEAYVKNYWESSDLSSLLTIFNSNRDIVLKAIRADIIKILWYRLIHIFRSNSLKKAPKNIIDHYDIGNDFYKIWLDSSMTYSSAIYNGKDVSLTKAQQLKYDRIIDELQIKPIDSVLDIGCGWGGFLNAAKKRSINNLTGITISPTQFEYSKKLLPTVNLKLLDYRLLKEKYSKIVSIEMFEAVGEKYWKSYFKTVFNCLKKNGKALIQVIVISEKIYPNYRKNVDFAQKYIFPGGMLPTKSIFKKLAEKAGLKVVNQFEFGNDYSKTLKTWLKNFEANWLEIKKLGYDDHFIRLWKYYLAYCIAGFNVKTIDVIQFKLIKV